MGLMFISCFLCRLPLGGMSVEKIQYMFAVGVEKGNQCVQQNSSSCSSHMKETKSTTVDYFVKMPNLGHHY